MTGDILENFDRLLDTTDDPQEWDKLTAKFTEAVRQNCRFVALQANDGSESLVLSAAENSEGWHGWCVSGEFSPNVLMSFPKKFWHVVG